jgi:hypothetical protein
VIRHTGGMASTDPAATTRRHYGDHRPYPDPPARLADLTGPTSGPIELPRPSATRWRRRWQPSSAEARPATIWTWQGFSTVAVHPGRAHPPRQRSRPGLRQRVVRRGSSRRWPFPSGRLRRLWRGFRNASGRSKRRCAVGAAPCGPRSRGSQFLHQSRKGVAVPRRLHRRLIRSSGAVGTPSLPLGQPGPRPGPKTRLAALSSVSRRLAIGLVPPGPARSAEAPPCRLRNQPERLRWRGHDPPLRAGTEGRPLDWRALRDAFSSAIDAPDAAAQVSPEWRRSW